MFRSRNKNNTDKNGDDSAVDPEEYWAQVKFPTDDLDQFMWGSEGIPPPAPPISKSPKYQKKWAKEEEVEEGKDNVEDNGSGAGRDNGTTEKNDNIILALEESAKDAKPPPVPDNILLEDIVWKQRSGFGKYSIGLLNHEWEQRRVVLFESGILRYYELPKNLEGVHYDPSHATNPEKSPWVYDSEQEPRGEMDLNPVIKEQEGGGDGEHANSNGGIEEEEEDSNHPLEEGIKHINSGMRRLSSLVHTDKSLNVGGVKVQARERQSDPGPTPFEIDVTRKDTNEIWRFCFQSQSIQIEWLSMLKQISGTDGDDDESVIGKDGLSHNHGFQPGDHILRWEMLPVLYPIQIHGIVLEAGSNCVIIADFGLASYDNQRAIKEEGLTTLSEDEDSKHDHDVIMAAWEKIKPKEKKRLNVIVVTDPKEIRKWSKVKYGDQVEKEKKGGFFKSWLPWDKKKVKKRDGEVINEVIDESDEGVDGIEHSKSSELDIDAASSAVLEAPNDTSQNTAKVGNEQQQQSKEAKDKIDMVEGEPEWAQPGYRPRKRTGSSSTVQINDEGLSVFSIDHPDEHGKNELPKSDSAKLVLARTHFILENEDLLPPYHVSFYFFVRKFC